MPIQTSQQTKIYLFFNKINYLSRQADNTRSITKTRYLMQTPRSFLKIVLLTSDFLIVNTSFIVPFVWIDRFNQELLPLWLFFNFSWLLFAMIFSLYSRKNMTIEAILRSTLKTYLLQIPLFVLVLKSFHLSFSEELLVSSFGTAAVLLITSRIGLTYFTEFILNNKHSGRKTGILGYNALGIKLADYIQNQSTNSFVGFFDDHISGLSVDTYGNFIVQETVDQCIDYALENNIREIYSTILPGQQPILSALVHAADQHCIRVKFVTDLELLSDQQHHVEHFEDFKVLSLRSEPLQAFEARVKKRLFDIVVSGLVIVLILSWLYPLIALLIKLESKGPVLFRQQRSGEYNKAFTCLKFRSMKVNKDSDLKQAHKGDHRITRIGSILRKTSLDEFPQFFNVLMGDMSIVGPRPHMLKHTEQYSALIRKYMIRQFLKPGITGWAQVNGYRGETKVVQQMAERVEHDIWYMENWSLMLDVKIIFMTIINVVKGEENAI